MEPEGSLPHSQMTVANESVENVTKIRYTIFTGSILHNILLQTENDVKKIEKTDYLFDAVRQNSFI